MTIYVVLEDATGVRLLERVLPSAGDRCVRLLDGGDARSAVYVPHSIRGSRGDSVVLLLSSRSVDPDNIDYQRENKEEVLAILGTPLRTELLFAVPELEAVLFQDPSVVERLLGIELTDEDRIEARFIPKRVLARLLERSGRFADEAALIDALDEWAVRRIAEHPLIRDLEALIADLRANPVSEEMLLRRTG